MLRRIAGAIAGGMVAMLVVGLVQAAGLLLFPLPPGFDVSDPARVASLMDAIPLGQAATIIIAWALGAAAGGFVATIIGRHHSPANLMAAMILVATTCNLAAAPFPWWMWLFGLLVPLPCAAIGAALAKGVRAATPLPESDRRARVAAGRGG